MTSVHFHHLIRVSAAAFLVAALEACGPTVDARAALQIESVSTGWVDAGSAGASHKIVPSVSFRVKNASGSTLAPVQVNAIFRRAGSADEWSNGMVTAAGSRGLARDTATDRLVINSQLGYTGTDSAWDLLQNSRFIDATVDLFVRFGSTQWTRIGEYPIARRIVER